ncbi:MAG TPA: PAS domain-containing protein [Kiritimatiellia bacterium]|nr:PAS domain-containing protein [Kiritimatiellia bacterium]
MKDAQMAAGQHGDRAPERLAELEEQQLWLEREIMERKRAEQALRESEERLRVAIRTSPITLFIQDRALRYTWLFNPVGSWTAAQVIGRTDEELLGAEQGGRLRAIKQAVMDSNREHSEVISLNYDSADHWFNLSASPMHGDHGDVVGVICASLDITPMKNLERERAELDARYRAIVDTFDGMIYICNDQNDIEFMNRKLIERTGRCAVGEKCYAALHGLKEICPWCRNERVMSGEKVRWEVQSPLDGRWYYVVNTPIDRPDGSRAKMAAIFDITERKESELKHDEMLQTMMRSHHLESMARLTGNIAHHFNNQLTVVLGNVELAASDVPPDSPLQVYFSEIRTAAERAAQLSGEMLTCSGHAFSSLRTGDLSQLVDSCRALVEVAVAPRITVRYQLTATGTSVRMDARLLQQLLLNWATNSAEAVGERQGELLIETGVRDLTAVDLARQHPPSTRKPGRYAFLAVHDTGGGLAPEMENRLFDPFAGTKGVGRGLGLAVSLGIASAHNGGIEVLSRPGNGCTFTLYLPVDPSVSAAT